MEIFVSNNIGRELRVKQCRKGEGKHLCLTI
jgi:hypothetical protein